MIKGFTLNDERFIKGNIVNINDNDYICISDFTKVKDVKSTSDDIIRNWLRNRITLEFLGTWESIYNPNFNSVEFDGFKSEAGLHTFTLSVTEWCNKTIDRKEERDFYESIKSNWGCRELRRQKTR